MGLYFCISHMMPLIALATCLVFHRSLIRYGRNYLFCSCHVNYLVITWETTMN